jgi:hypothetical protein
MGLLEVEALWGCWLELCFGDAFVYGDRPVLLAHVFNLQKRPCFCSIAVYCSGGEC